MGQFFHHTPCDAHWMPKALERRHSTGCQRASIHNQGIQFDLADQVRQSTVSNGVILRIVLDGTDSDLDGVQCLYPSRKPSIATGKPTAAFGEATNNGVVIMSHPAKHRQKPPMAA
jgi:hypothetical protein